uniref:Leukocyte receptor cluster member 4 n=1 Tax=Cercocebus atys TaxID=9531 RepID=A0A2K5LMG1_CERAT
SCCGPGASPVHLWPPHFAFSDHHPWDREMGVGKGPKSDLLVSLASEVQDLHLAQRKEMASGFSKGPTLGLLPDVPSLMETLSYSYCYVGIMTGPFFRYRTYLDWLEQPFPGAVPSLRPLLRRAWPAPLFGLLFLLSSHLFPLEAVREDAFYARPLPARLFYMIPVFFAFRMRFYVAWIAAECGCIAAGFGAYPVAAKARAGGGPTLQCPPPSSPEKAASLEYDYETIRNIDCYGTDFCVRVRDGMRYWNMTVQWWLAQYIYKSSAPASLLLREAWTIPTILLCPGFAEGALVLKRAYDYSAWAFVLRLSLADTLALAALGAGGWLWVGGSPSPRKPHPSPPALAPGRLRRS